MSTHNYPAFMLLALKVKCVISEAPNGIAKIMTQPMAESLSVKQTALSQTRHWFSQMLLCEYGRDALCKAMIAQPNHSLNFLEEMLSKFSDQLISVPV